MKTYIVTVYHSGTGEQNLCYVYPTIVANSFCMAIALGEAEALRSPRTGTITKVEAELNK